MNTVMNFTVACNELNILCGRRVLVVCKTAQCFRNNYFSYCEKEKIFFF